MIVPLSTPIHRLAFVAAIVSAVAGGWWKSTETPVGRLWPRLAYTYEVHKGGGIWWLEPNADSFGSENSHSQDLLELSGEETPPEYSFRYADRSFQVSSCPISFSILEEPYPPAGIRELGLTVCNAARISVDELEAMRPEVRDAAIYHYKKFAGGVFSIGLFSVLAGVGMAGLILAASRLLSWIIRGK